MLIRKEYTESNAIMPLFLYNFGRCRSYSFVPCSLNLAHK